MSDSPVFIGGMYKSGTSLVRAMIGRHSKFFAGLETQWVHEDWTHEWEDSRQDWFERLSVFFDSSPEELAAVCDGVMDVETCLDRIMGYLAHREGKPRWVEKTPGNAGAIQRIVDFWPEAFIVHVTRDPRDVYASLFEIEKWTDPEEFAQRWCATAGAARVWLQGMGGEYPRYREIPYERLVTNPEQETGKLLEFLGEDWEPHVADFRGQPKDLERVREATGKESTTLRRLAKPLTTERIGIWKDTIPEGRWELVRKELERRGAGPLVDELTSQADLKSPLSR